LHRGELGRATLVGVDHANVSERAFSGTADGARASKEDAR
jgi:hypothetical protein